MKQARTGCMVFLCMLFAMFIFVQQTQRIAYAQDEPKAHDTPPQQPEAKPEAQPDKQENAKPEQPAKQDKSAEKQEKKDQKDNAKQEEKENKNNANGRQETPAAQQTRPEGGSMPAQTGQAGQMRAAGKGGHIPDDKFRASFGKSHTFVVNQPVVVNNQPTFQYAGYSFVLIDPWPAGWAYTDQCYIDYIDGEYFLFDLLHPGVQIALFVAM